MVGSCESRSGGQIPCQIVLEVESVPKQVGFKIARTPATHEVGIGELGLLLKGGEQLSGVKNSPGIVLNDELYDLQSESGLSSGRVPGWTPEQESGWLIILSADENVPAIEVVQVRCAR